MITEEFEIFIPVSAITTIFNGDPGILTDKEIAEVTEWEKSLYRKGYTYSIDITDYETVFSEKSVVFKPTDCYRAILTYFKE